MNTTNKRGFTIIEVVLVLAIAALIFLMVFIALPALQRNQRDTARKQEIGKVLAAVTSYQSNSSGANPAINAAFAKYLDAPDPGNSGTIKLTTMDLKKVTSNTTPSDNGVILLAFGAKCTSGQIVVDSTISTRKAVAATMLENGSVPYCQEG
jgi:prepilin-type N-terminal cleavage/methylation domain-containing protein